MKNYTVFNMERHHGSDADTVVQHISNTIDQRIKNNQISEKIDVVIATVFWEEYYFDDASFLQLIYAVADSLSARSIRLVLLINDYYDHICVEHDNISTYFIDFFLWRTYDQVVQKRRSRVNKIWNPSANQFLFLTGKPYKPQRLRLLWKFQQQGLLDRCEWSLHTTPQSLAAAFHTIPEMTHQSLSDFCVRYQRNPDDITVETQLIHYSGIPYNADLYHHNRFRVISETFCNDDRRPFITEKTWITILNNMPFIMAGDAGSLAYLNDKGFRTYEKYCTISHYDHVRPAESRLDAVVENARHFLDDHSQDVAIHNDSLHNVRQFYVNADQCRSVLDELVSHHRLQDADLDEICATDLYSRNW